MIHIAALLILSNARTAIIKKRIRYKRMAWGGALVEVVLGIFAEDSIGAADVSGGNTLFECTLDMVNDVFEFMRRSGDESKGRPRRKTDCSEDKKLNQVQIRTFYKK